MKRRELEQRLKRMGWQFSRHGRNHDVWKNDEREITVPRHSEINEYTAKAILKDAKGEK